MKHEIVSSISENIVFMRANIFLTSVLSFLIKISQIEYMSPSIWNVYDCTDHVIFTSIGMRRICFHSQAAVII